MTDGSIYVCGNTRTASGQYNIVIIKYNSSGTEQWTRIYNGTGNFDDIAVSIISDSNQNIYVGGYSYGAGSGYDFVLLKYNSSGDSLWVKRWNGSSNSDDYLQSISLTSGGDIIAAGASFDVKTSNDFIILKYNPAGSLQWTQKYDGTQSGDDQVSCLKTDTQNNIYVCGKSSGSGTGYDYALIKYNSAGGKQWVERYTGLSANDDIPVSVDVDVNGNVFITGYSWQGNSFFDFATIKYNSGGALQWTRYYNGPANFIDKAVDIKADTDGNTYVTGQTIKSDGTNDIVSLKYNSSGTVQWTKTYDGPGGLDDIPVMMKIDLSGSVFVIGSSYSYFFGLCGTTDYVILKYNFSGTIQWDTRYDGSGKGPDEATYQAIDNKGNSYTTGFSFDNISGFDYATLKYNSTGLPLWAVRYDGGNGIDKPAGIAVDNSGYFYLTGSSIGIGIGYEIATVKYDSNGDLSWERRYNGVGNADDFASAMIVDGSGNIYITGYSDGVGTGKDYITLKYNSAGTLQWVSRYNGPGNSNDFAAALAADPSGNVYVTGRSIGSGTLEDFATVKYNSSGAQQWVSRYNGAANDTDEAIGIALAMNGSVTVTGKSKSSGLNYDIITVNYNSSGSQQWISAYDGTANSNDEACSVVTDNSGNLYVSGSSKNIGTGFDMTTIKYNPSGSRLWASVYNGTANGNDKSSASCIDNAGNLYVTGSCEDAGSSLNFCTIKYSGTGQTMWTRKYNHIDNDTDRASSVIVDNNGNVYVAGFSKDLEGGKDYLTIKYEQDKVLQLNSLIEARYDESTDRMIPDTLKIYLRNSVSPYNKADSSVAVPDSSGSGLFYFFNAQSSQKYYLVINHKNSLETWSSAAQNFTSGSINYDFTLSASQSYGNNSRQKGNRFCIYSGDVNKNGSIDVIDISIVDNAVYNFESGYSISDLNGDMTVDAIDITFIDNNAFNFVSLIRP